MKQQDSKIYRNPGNVQKHRSAQLTSVLLHKIYETMNAVIYKRESGPVYETFTIDPASSLVCSMSQNKAAQSLVQTHSWLGPWRSVGTDHSKCLFGSHSILLESNNETRCPWLCQFLNKSPPSCDTNVSAAHI
jgi:hypothetical protein